LKTDFIYKQWQAPQTKAVLLLIHGLGAHNGRWGFLADFLLQNEFSAYAIDLRGFGKSQDLKGHIESVDIYINDLHRLYQIIREENKGKKIFVAGESAGALLGILLASRKTQDLAGLACLSPAFKSRLKFSFLDYLKVYTTLLYNPKKQFNLPFNAQMCTRDLNYQKFMEEDPYEHRVATARLLVETLKVQTRAQTLITKLDIPVLFLLAGEDRIVDPKASRKVFQGLKTQDKEIIEYPQMYHSLSIELEREKVFADILQWLEKRIGGAG
jgi:alpha-beta hydrolase superfamily lysophospholipase